MIHFVCCIFCVYDYFFMTIFLLKLRPMAFFCCWWWCCFLLLLFVVVVRCLWFVCFCLLLLGFLLVCYCCCCCCCFVFVCFVGFCFLHAEISYRSVIAEKFINEMISFRRPEVRSCVKVEVAVLGSPSLIVHKDYGLCGR